MPFAFFIATVWGAIRGTVFLVCRLDVYKLLFFTGHAWGEQFFRWTQHNLLEPRLLQVGDSIAWILLSFTVMLGILIPRPFCRAVCPYSVLLGLFSVLGFRRRQIDSAECTNCGICTKKCPVQAIEAVEDQLIISNFHCIQCGRCNAACRKNAINNDSRNQTFSNGL